MEDFQELWPEAEQIPDDVIPLLFQPPPDVPPHIRRPALLVGTKGAGKTLLLRTLKQRHDAHGVAIRLSLLAVFQEIPRQHHLGPLEHDVTPELARLVAANAISSLALAVADRFVGRGIEPPFDELMDCLPASVRQNRTHLDHQTLGVLQRGLVAAAPGDFEGLTAPFPLARFLDAAGLVARRNVGPLLLLLDRADMVSTAALDSVLALLDQTENYTTVVATRPGLVRHGDSSWTEAVVPGDHYSIFQLGTNPRSATWLAFAEDALRVQLKGTWTGLGKELRGHILAIARDSLGTVVEIFDRCSREQLATNPEQALKAAIGHVRGDRLNAAQAKLQQFHPSFGRLVDELRSATHRQGPVILSIQAGERPQLFPETTRLDRFTSLALRLGALSMPEGVRWQPGLMASEFEVPPLLMWSKDEPFWSAFGNPPQEVLERRQVDVLKFAGGRQITPKIFVAYRMREPASNAFLAGFRRTVRLRARFSDVEILDGKVAAGENWAGVIRDRIKSAKLAVGDITGLRNDVMFELGFAWGLGKRIVPVVESSTEELSLPEWLTEIQIGSFADPLGLQRIVEDVAFHLEDLQHAKPRVRPKAIPELCGWLRPLKWTTLARERFYAALTREGLRSPEIYDLHESHEEQQPLPAFNPDEIVRSSLLVAALDGTLRDSFVHFVCGAIVARPTAGETKKILHRKVLLVPYQGSDPLVADSLRRCKGIVEIIGLDDIPNALQPFLAEYNRWRKSE